MRYATISILLGILLVRVAAAQESPTSRRYLAHAELHHKEAHVDVIANYPRPLERVVAALNQEYGWVVDYEDPPYSSTIDLVDDTDPNWRKAHPTEKGVRGIAGGEFTSDFTEGEYMTNDSVDESRVLRKIIADYNGSGNPGRFEVRQGINRLLVTGVGVRQDNGSPQQVVPILDTPVSITLVQRNAADAVHAIVQVLSAKTGQRIIMGVIPNNALFQTQVSIGGNEEPARQLLSKVLAAPRHAIVWNLLFDPNFGYTLNLSIVTKLGADSFSHPLRVSVPNKARQ